MKLVRKMLLALIVVALVYAVLCAAAFALQRSLIYFPQPRSNQEASTLMTLRVGTETIQISIRPYAGPEAVLYFGGNAEDVSQDAPDLANTFPRTAIYLLDYPGYGGSSGNPSQQSIFAAALALYDRVRAEHPNITIIGRSLGSGVAVWLASQRPVARLILVTPFYSLADVAAHHYPYLPVRWLLRDKYDSWSYAAHVTAPTRIIVAADDEIIPRSSSDRLRTSFRDGLVSYVVVPGAGHNDIQLNPDYWNLLKTDGRASRLQ
jgi:pimeloyl-ACP methyl ester carboxylesterase